MEHLAELVEVCKLIRIFRILERRRRSSLTLTFDQVDPVTDVCQAGDQGRGAEKNTQVDLPGRGEGGARA
jgi:hypothetical protein